MNRPHTWPADPLMAVEHGALLRWVGRLQRRMDHLVTQAQALVAAQEAEILRLRGQLLVARTAALWGMSGMRRSTLAPRSPAVATRVKERRPGPWSASMAAARAVVCQTGCLGHAHHWLDDAGDCRLDGRQCDTMNEVVRPCA